MSLKNIKEKVMKAAVEGKLLRKTFNKIIKEFGVDRLIGILAKKVVFRNEKVVNNKIFFNTFQGDYTCNPKYITEELIRQNINCDIVWGVRLSQIIKDQDVPKQVRLVNRYTYEFYREMVTSKIWIVNSVEIFKNPIYKKKSQYLIQTWHGSLGIKRFDKNVNTGKAWVKAAEFSSKFTDFCISNSSFENNILRKSFWDKAEILEYGHPRNDILFSKDNNFNSIKAKVKSKLDIEDNIKYILYAPTFRDAKNFDCYDIDFDRLVIQLKNKFGGDWKVLVRFHPTVRELSINKLKRSEILVDATNYLDIQELMMISDIAITDYSSWIYDFVLTKKPGFIYATDIEEYNNERGFYYPLEKTPFSIATNNEELLNNILKFDNHVYQSKVEEFLKDKGCVEDGKASYRVVEKIKEIIGE